MKKILSILILVAFAFTVKAQNNVSRLVTTTTYGNTLDTVTNAGVKSTTTSTVADWFANKSVQAEIIVTKISGTVGGTLGLYGSMDGTNWVICETATTPSDATANYYISTTKRYYKYKVMWTGTGTMAASMKTYFLY